MPQLPTRTSSGRLLSDALAEQAAFTSRANWRTSVNGNRWRKWGNITLTIFRDRQATRRQWCWSLRHGDGSVEYSRLKFRSYYMALMDLEMILDVGR